MSRQPKVVPEKPAMGLWLDPTFGASGDMLLGALHSLGASLEGAIAELKTLDIPGWAIHAEHVQRSSITATRVRVESRCDSAHRAWSAIDGLLAESSLPDSVSKNSRTTFRLLGQVEAQIHGVDIDDVTFHEVGAIDAIVDIVGSWLLLDELNPATVTVGSVGLGYGTIETAHGTLSLPAPATTAILTDAPVHPVAVEAETTTPTGAALLKTMATSWGQIPAGTIRHSGRGAGQRNPQNYPNILTASLIEETTQPLMLATNLDDVTAEVVGSLLDRLLEAGADDAWVTAIGMKKNRPGYELNILASADRRTTIEDLVFRETQTLGMRAWPVTKTALPRRSETIELRGASVRIKVGPYGCKPEHDDLAALAAASGVSLKQLSFEAQRSYEDRHADDKPSREAASVSDHSERDTGDPKKNRP